MLLFSDLKAELRPQLWPAGEAANLRPDHDRQFIDALVEVARLCDCWQTDNYTIVPQCATFYDCGLTVFDLPRGTIPKRLSVIDKINPTTQQEDAASPDDWCSEIIYTQVDPCHVRQYLQLSHRQGCCLSIPLFFGLMPSLCAKAAFPVPTDVGLDPALPRLPLGFHYAQTSTDRKFRSLSGVWAIERGKIFVAPWIQSTETIVLMWDGVKRNWNDADPVDQSPGDPTLKTAVLEYVRWKHADKWDRDEAEALRAQTQFLSALERLMMDCREETRVRNCERSLARSSPGGMTALFFNDEQKATAFCPSGQVGSATVVIPAGTVGSTRSVADANQLAATQAQAQAQQQLSCATPGGGGGGAGQLFTNVARQAQACCVSDPDAPPPDGGCITVTVPAGSLSAASQTEADSAAYNLALQRATAQLVGHCTFWNREKTVTAICPSDQSNTATVTVPQHSYSSHVSQAVADNIAHTHATQQAQDKLALQGCGGIFWNTEQHVSAQCSIPKPPTTCLVKVNVTVTAHSFSSYISQFDANYQAQIAGTAYARQRADDICRRGEAAQCGTYNFTFP